MNVYGTSNMDMELINMEQVKEYHRNLAVTFFDCKKTYEKVHHD